MALFDDAINEARSLGSQILDALIEGNRQREKAAADKPPARALSKLDVVAEAQLRSYPFEAGVAKLIYDNPAGIYTKLNHWIAQLKEEDTCQLYYGTNAEALGIFDSANKALFPVSNPNELILPPQTGIYVFSPKSGIITLSLTTYQLSA